MLLLNFFLSFFCFAAAQLPQCTTNECSAFLDSMVARLPTICGQNASAAVCTREIDDQLRSIIPSDAEAVWTTRLNNWLQIYQECERIRLQVVLNGNRSTWGGFTCPSLFFKRENARILAASTPGSYEAVTALAFNLSIPIYVRQLLQNRRITCALRDLWHLRRLRASCDSAAPICASLLDARIVARRFDLRLCRLESANRPLKISFSTVPISTMSRDYEQRTCVGSDVPFRKCDSELWNPLFDMVSFNSSVLLNIERAVDPDESNNVFVSYFKQILMSDDEDLNGGSGRCFFSVCFNGTFARMERIARLLEDGIVDTNGTKHSVWTSLTSFNIGDLSGPCWFRCGLRSNLKKQVRLVQRQQLFAKYDMLSTLQLYCPFSDTSCSNNVNSERASLQRDGRLPFAAATSSSFYVFSVSADPGVVVAGLAISCTSAVIAGFFLFWGRSAWQVPHARILLLISLGVCLSSILRILWWVSFTEAAESWTEIAEFGQNPYVTDSASAIVKFWADMLVLVVLIGIFCFVLDYWINALAYIIGNDMKYESGLITKRWILFVFSCATIVASVAFAIYFSVTLVPSSLDRSSLLELNAKVIAFFQALSVIALAIASFVLLVSCIGLTMLEPRHYMPVAKTIALFSFVDIGLAFRVAWAFTRPVLPVAESDAVLFPVCYILGDALIFFDLLTFVMIGLLGLIWKRDYSEKEEPLLAEKEREDDIPLAYQ